MANIDRVLGLVGPALMTVLLLLLLRRKLHLRFPVFFTYCLSIVAVAVLRFLVAGNATAYFYVYWATEAAYVVIAFVAMLSVLNPLTQMFYIRHPWSQVVLVPSLLVIVGISLWMAVFRPVGAVFAGRFASAMYVFVILMSLAEFVLFVIAFRSKGRYPIRWTPYEFGILAGFGVLGFLNVIAYSALVLRLLHIYVPPQLETFFHSFPPGVFVGSAAVWLISFRKPEPPPPAPPPDLVGRLQDALRVLAEQIEFVKEIAKHLGLHFGLRHRIAHRLQ